MSSSPLSTEEARRLDQRINRNLQVRGKKEERKRRLKPLLILLALVFIGGPVILALTPAYPQKFFDEYRKMGYSEELQGVDPEAVKNLYYLGVFYKYTGRPEKAMECWNQIGEWRTGVILTDWATNPKIGSDKIRDKIRVKKRAKSRNENPDALVPWAFNNEALHWLARTYMRIADKIYTDDRRDQPSGYLYARIAAEGLDSRDIGLDEEEIAQARKRSKKLEPEWLGW